MENNAALQDIKINNYWQVLIVTDSTDYQHMSKTNIDFLL